MAQTMPFAAAAEPEPEDEEEPPLLQPVQDEQVQPLQLLRQQSPQLVQYQVPEGQLCRAREWPPGGPP